MAKTDWMLDDTVLPEDMNGIGAEINANADKLADNLDKQPWAPVTLKSGVQVVQGGDVPAILHPTMQGRTLVNLLGRNGNGEDSSKWSTSGTSASISVDTANKVYGLASLKITATGVTAGASNTIPVVSGKHYLAISEIKNGTLPNNTSMAVFFGGRGNAMTQTDKFAISYIVHSPSSSGNVVYWAAHVPGEATSGQYFYADGMRVFEITAAEKSYIDGLTVTAAQTYIVAKYPYVDDMKHVNGVYIENKGKNLLPPFSEWTLHANAVVVEPYKLVLNATANNQQSTVDVSVVPGALYRYARTASTGNAVTVYNVNADGTTGAGIDTGSGPFIPTGNKLRFIAFNLNGVTGAVTFENPMLNIDSEAIPFEPQKPSYLYLPDCNLRSNVDGSVADRLYTDGQGKPRVTRRFREIVLDGGHAVALLQNNAGYRIVGVDTAKDSIANQGILVKFDGKVIIVQNMSIPFSASDQCFVGNSSTAFSGNEVGMTVANTDSGWGEGYTPTADEIKAYFYGWRMYNNDAALPNTYNGTGTKRWGNIASWTGAVFTDATGTLPVQAAPGFTPYRLMYQLAQSVDEPVTYEGSLMLHEGANQIEVGTGIVVREAANPILYGDGYFINRINVVDSRLKNRASKIRGIYKNNTPDAWAVILADAGYAYGIEMAKILTAGYDLTATYSVTYLALDTYKLGIAPQTISAEYAPNIRESVESLVHEVVEARTETSVLQECLDHLETDSVEGIGNFVKYVLGDNERAVRRWTEGASSINKAGFYYIQVDHSGMPLATDHFLIHTMNTTTVNNNTGMQIAAPFGSDRMFYRRKNNGTWADWVELISSAGGTITGVLDFAPLNGPRISLRPEVDGTTLSSILFKKTDGTNVWSVGYQPASNQFSFFDVSAGLHRFRVELNGQLVLNSGARIVTGTGSPEGAVTAVVGSIFLRTDGAATTTLYVKTSGTGNTGWTAK